MKRKLFSNKVFSLKEQIWSSKIIYHFAKGTSYKKSVIFYSYIQSCLIFGTIYCLNFLSCDYKLIAFKLCLEKSVHVKFFIISITHEGSISHVKYKPFLSRIDTPERGAAL